MGDLHVQVVETAEELDRAGADLVGGVIDETPAASIVVATGRTPMGLYAELAARRRSGGLQTDALRAVQLDEYLRLEPDDRRSLFGWMRRSFLEPLGVSDERVIRLPLDGDLKESLAEFDRALDDRGPVDLAILGLGENGHLGFNEPPSRPEAPTRAVDLSPSTVQANARYWGDPSDVPTAAVTLGMRHLLSPRATLLVVSGVKKHSIVHRTLEGPVDPTVPASFLRQAAGIVTVVVDRAAWEGR